MYQADSVRVKISLLHCVKDSLNMHLTYANLKIDNLKDPNLAQFLWMLVLMHDLVQDPSVNNKNGDDFTDFSMCCEKMIK
jgi:hypothetical protein